jgi:hypothetical protein
MLKNIPAALLSVLLAAPAFAADVTYQKDIFPVWDAKCSACHGANAPYLGDFLKDDKKYIKQMQGPRMDTYADLLHFVGWPDTAALMRRLDDGSGSADHKPGNMYPYLGDTDVERQTNFKLFKAWIGEEGWTLKRWNARGAVPAVTKEELSRIRAKY